MILILIVLWYIVGIISMIFITCEIDNEFRLSDILVCLYFGIAGPIVTIMLLILKYEYSFKTSNKVLWKKKSGD